MTLPSIPMLVKSIKATKTGFVYSLVSDYDLNDGADAVDFHKLKLYTSRLFEDIKVGDHVGPCLHPYQPNMPAPGSGLSGLLASLLGNNPAFQGGAFPGQTFTVPSPHDQSQDRVRHPVFGDAPPDLGDIRVTCGPTGEEDSCACGCAGDDSRCSYWQTMHAGDWEVDEDHTCCAVDPMVTMQRAKAAQADAPYHDFYSERIGEPEQLDQTEAQAEEKWKQYYRQVSGEGVPVIVEHHEDNTVRPQAFEEDDYPTGHHETVDEPTAWAESQAEINERRNS